MNEYMKMAREQAEKGMKSNEGVLLELLLQIKMEILFQ